VEEWNMIIRRERDSDIDAIFAITKAAFENHPISNHTEQYIVNALRAAKALSLSLVAEVDGRVVGHIAFSPVTISDGSENWYGIGPVSVLPEFQRKGCGKALINEGLTLLKASGAQGCLLVGDPSYYQRFGFRNIPELTLAGVPPENFLGLPFGKHIPHGQVTFHPAFSAKPEQFQEGCWLINA
jgi:putative acetyltransferase